MDSISITVIAVISIATIIYGYFKYSFQYWKSKGVCYEEPSFPLGSMSGLGKKYHLYEILERVYHKFKPTGAKLCGFYILNRPIALLLDVELIKSVFVKDFANFREKGLYYNEEDDPLSAHLFSLDGEKWKKLRAKLTPTFTSGKMKYMFPTVVEVGERFRDCVSEAIKHNDQLEIKELMCRYTTDVIGTCAFGIECNSLKDPNTEFRRYGRKLFNDVHVPIWIMQAIWKDLARKLHIKVLRDDVASFFMNVVRNTVNYREDNNITRSDFMDIMINLKNKNDSEKEHSITFDELAAQAFIFFVAGFETSSTTLLFCLYELAVNPDIQAKVRRVIQEAYVKYNGEFTYEMMMDMPYIDQVLEETLRKYPPLPLLNRKTKEDYRIEGTDIVLESGRMVLIPVHAVHHDPEYYPNPDKFDPERFSSEEKKKRHPMTWFPFGEGPRNCIGLRFGMMEARIGLITLLNNFEFSVGSKTNVPLIISKTSFVLSPQHDLYLKVQPIK